MSRIPTYQYQPIPTKGQKAKRVAQTMAISFGMGFFVGSTVVMLHTVLNPSGPGIPRFQGAFRRAAQSGGAFGCIFAIGSLIRPGVLS